MARFIEQGKSIFIPFRNGLSITDSQLHVRMYKTVEMFKRYGYTCGEVDMLCEYAPVVRCKDCIHWHETEGVCLKIYSDGAVSPYAWQDRNPDDFCSYGERKANESMDQ